MEVNHEAATEKATLDVDLGLGDGAAEGWGWSDGNLARAYLVQSALLAEIRELARKPFVFSETSPASHGIDESEWVSVDQLNALLSRMEGK